MLLVRLLFFNQSDRKERQAACVKASFKTDRNPDMIPLMQCFPKCNRRTTGGTRKDFKGYVAENKLLKIIPEFYLLSDKL
jgi:hypothetical protein